MTSAKKPETGPRGGTSTISPGGLIRKAFYMHPDEVEALRRAAFERRCSEAEIVREAVRRYLDVED